MNVETALLQPANTSFMISPAREPLDGHHAGGCGGCAGDNGKGEKES